MNAPAGLRLQIEYVPIDVLKAGPNQTRRHTRTQLKQLARSIQEHGFLVPVVVYGDDVIAAGNARVAAAKLKGLRDVPIVRAEHLTDEQMRLHAASLNEIVAALEQRGARVKSDEEDSPRLYRHVKLSPPVGLEGVTEVILIGLKGS